MISFNENKNNKPHIYIPTLLQKQLGNIHNYRLIVVQAPSGFGKTTAINEYLHEVRTNHVYWYTCMGESIRKAWNGICHKFSYIDKRVAKRLADLQYPMQENLVDIADIISDCDMDGERWFIIDNFQYMQSKLPKNILYALSKHNCQQLHIVIITQFVDSIAVSRIPTDLLILIKEENFIFQKKDIDAYFRVNEIVLSNDEVNSLQMTSEGWIAALNLQLIRYIQMGDFANTDSMDNLIRAVIWNHLEVNEQRFLIAASLLGQFTIEQAYILLEGEMLPLGIVRLLDNHSFIHYERENGIYTLHSLLQNFLVKEFKGLCTDVVCRMKKLVADAYAVVGERYYALCNYLDAGVLEAIFSLSLKVADFSLSPKKHTIATLKQLLRECDKKIFVRHHQTLTIIIFELFRVGCYELFEEGCSLLEQIISQEEYKLNNSEIRILKGQLALLKSFAAFNDIKKMSELHHKAWKELGAPFSNRVEWNDSWTFGQPSVLYMFWSESGVLDRDLDCMGECLPVYIRLTDGHGSGADCAMRAETLLMRGKDIEAEILCYKAIQLSSIKKQDSISFVAEMTLLRIALIRGDVNEYENIRNHIIERGKVSGNPVEKKISELALSFVSAIIGESTIPEWLMDLDSINENLYDVAVPFGMLIYLNWLMHQKQYTKVLGIAEGVIFLAEQHKFILPQVYCYLLSAISYYYLKQKSGAEAALNHALSLAMPDGIYLPFAEYSEEIITLLKLKNIQSSMNELLSLCRRYKQGKEKIKEAFPKNKLTQREQAVALLAAGELTNREIALRLFISQETVKTTMKKIFKKLGIRSRVQLQNMKYEDKIKNNTQWGIYLH